MLKNQFFEKKYPKFSYTQKKHVLININIWEFIANDTHVDNVTYEHKKMTQQKNCLRSDLEIVKTIWGQFLYCHYRFCLSFEACWVINKSTKEKAKQKSTSNIFLY